MKTVYVHTVQEIRGNRNTRYKFNTVVNMYFFLDFLLNKALLLLPKLLKEAEFTRAAVNVRITNSETVLYFLLIN